MRDLLLIATLTIVMAIAVQQLATRMTASPANNKKYSYKAVRGYFSHDDDPASWEFRAVRSDKVVSIIYLTENRQLVLV
jgi:hypothetical protein